jgi:membrane protein YdbS with pleckstrin-like domain
MTDSAATAAPNDDATLSNGQGIPAHMPQFGQNDPPLQKSYNLGLTPLHTSYKMVLRINNGLIFLPILAGFIVGDIILAAQDITGFGPLTAMGALLWLIAVLIIPGRQFRRWGYAMEDDRLRVLRGFLFRTDTIVPFNRVQHIDVSQGPIERINNVSRLIVQTAGTHNSVVVLPGLEPETANTMREEMREHIREEMI